MKFTNPQLIRIICGFIVLSEPLFPFSVIGQARLSNNDDTSRTNIPNNPEILKVKSDMDLIRKSMLSDRPYKPNPAGIKQVVYINILPSTLSQSSSSIPDWWSEKQSYDVAYLYAIALSNYPGIKVLPAPTWDTRILSSESSTTIESNSDKSAMPIKAMPSASRSLTSSPLLLQSRFEIDTYKFQYMPVKRRGLGLGFIAITSKECSTETYLRSVVRLFKANPQIADTSSDKPLLDLPGEDQSLILDRLIVDKTGGTSLNMNFLVGGAGGGNFKEPAKPLKRILLESIVDSAEFVNCVHTANQKCIEYYQSRPLLSPTKLTKKQQKKVEAC